MYQINETAARTAHNLSSMSDYKEGSATAEYQAAIRHASQILADVKAKCSTEDQRDRAEFLFDRCAKTLADAINRENEIGTRCPSVLICGAGNFPTRKKEKQVAAWDKNRETWKKADHYLHLLSSAHTFPVKSNDPEALDFLRNKLEKLEACHESMKEANAFYRKHKTLDGCPGISDSTRAYITRPGVFLPGGKNGDGSPIAFYGKPFPTFSLSNSAATIKRTRERIQRLEAVKAAAPAEVEADGYTFKEDPEVMRVQFFFDGKPDEETRNILKENGFRWAPSIGAWQRQLTPAGQAAARRVMDLLKG